MDKEAEFKFILEEGPEVLLYLLINTQGAYLWVMEHDMADGRIPESAHAGIDAKLALARDQQKKAVAAATRFGVEKPLEEDGRGTPDYWRWYRWWNGYVERLPREEFEQLNQAVDAFRKASEKLAHWRPEGDWKEQQVSPADDQVSGS